MNDQLENEFTKLGFEISEDKEADYPLYYLEENGKRLGELSYAGESVGNIELFSNEAVKAQKYKVLAGILIEEVINHEPPFDGEYI
jgi:hypothetical protein